MPNSTSFSHRSNLGFWKGSSPKTISILCRWLNKIVQCNQPMCLVFMDSEKSFGSLGAWIVLNALQLYLVDWRYIMVFWYLNDMAITIQLQVHKTTSCIENWDRENHIPTNVDPTMDMSRPDLFTLKSKFKVFQGYICLAQAI